jgi:hypothetical protein
MGRALAPNYYSNPPRGAGGGDALVNRGDIVWRAVPAPKELSRSISKLAFRAQGRVVADASGEVVPASLLR